VKVLKGLLRVRGVAAGMRGGEFEGDLEEQ
jgi:hypothetical protein